MSDKKHAKTARYENSRVSETNATNKATTGVKATAEKNEQTVVRNERPTEFGGQKGPEPTRYGDWEKNGRCTDF